MAMLTTNRERLRTRVLYIEDEPSIAKLLSSGLRLFGIGVRPAFMSAEDLLEQLDSPDYLSASILIFDIRLPGMTGLDLALELRRQGENRPIILVSAWPPPAKEDLQKAQAIFLPKPFDFPEFVNTIESLL